MAVGRAEYWGRTPLQAPAVADTVQWLAQQAVGLVVEVAPAPSWLPQAEAHLRTSSQRPFARLAAVTLLGNTTTAQAVLRGGVLPRLLRQRLLWRPQPTPPATLPAVGATPTPAFALEWEEVGLPPSVVNRETSRRLVVALQADVDGLAGAICARLPGAVLHCDGGEELGDLCRWQDVVLVGAGDAKGEEASDAIAAAEAALQAGLNGMHRNLHFYPPFTHDPLALLGFTTKDGSNVPTGSPVRGMYLMSSP